MSVEGHRLDADLVLDASSRGGRIGDPLRAAPVGGELWAGGTSGSRDCFPALRQARSIPSIGFATPRVGYEGFVFVHDNGVISALLTGDGMIASWLDCA